MRYSLISTIKKIIRPIATPFLVFSFKAFVSRQKIRKRCQNSTLAKWNESGQKVPCQYCGSKNVKAFYRISLDDGFGLFDKNGDSLKLYYGTWIPEFIWNCFGIIRSSYLKYSFNELKKDLDLNYLRCEDCDLIFQNYPHESGFLDEYYRKYYRRIGGKLYGRAESLDAHHIKWKELVASHFLRIANLPLSSKVLDVGCAEGCFCWAINNSGMEAYGIDPAEPMINYAKKVLKLKNVKCSDYHKFSYAPESFDAVHCFHVLEHILDIDSILKSMYFHLKPNGILSLSVPCVDWAKNEDDFGLILCFDHIFIFSEKWFRSHLPKYGFEIFKVIKSSFDLKKYGYDHPGQEFSVTPWGDVRGGIYIFARKKTK